MEQLSNIEKEEPLSVEVQHFLTFYLQDEMFGINIKPILEICEYANVTKVPMVPPYVRGVMNLRGDVVPVIDLPARFGWQPSEINKRSCIVIIEVCSATRPIRMGVVIDRVSEVLDLDENSINASPNFGTSINTDFISAMGKINDSFIVLLDTENILSLEEQQKLQQVAQSMSGEKIEESYE